MGKTVVFVTVALERVTAGDGLQCVVLVHTRELAFQVKNEFDRFKIYLQPTLSVQCIYGGVPLADQEKALAADPPNIIVACPGRLKLLLTNKKVDLSHLKIFVIDEVDKVLEKADMRADVQEIFYKTPKNKQTMCFSATLPPEMKATVMKFVRNVSVLSFSTFKCCGFFSCPTKIGHQHIVPTMIHTG
jgi:ATP-dependent RNA helicase UAP56/SUB2